ALAASPHIGGLRRLLLHRQRLDDLLRLLAAPRLQTVTSLCFATGSVRVLQSEGLSIHLAGTLFPSMRDEVCRLFRHPALCSLQELWVGNVTLSPDVLAALAEGPLGRLQGLSIWACALNEQGLGVLLRAPWLARI